MSRFQTHLSYFHKLKDSNYELSNNKSELLLGFYQKFNPHVGYRPVGSGLPGLREVFPSEEVKATNDTIPIVV